MPRRRAVVVALIALLAIPANAGASHQTLAGQWHLDEAPNGNITFDSSGHDNHAVPNLGPEIIPGKFGNTFNFDAPDRLELDVPQPSDDLEPPKVSVLAWIRSNGNPGPVEYVLAKGANGCGSSASYALYTGGAVENDGRLRFYVDAGSDLYKSPAAPESVYDNQWHAIAGTFDGSTVRLYVDGAQVGNGNTFAPASVDYSASTDTFSIGSYPEENPVNCRDFFRPGIDEVRVYDRALTADEVALVSTGAALPGGVGDLPRNVVAPKIVANGDGSYRCDPGEWDGLQPGATFGYRWVNTTARNVGSKTDTFTPSVAAYGSVFVCVVSATNEAGTASAASGATFFTSGGLNRLPPPYGDVRIRGIDVFQVVQPNSGAQMFGFPAGAFPDLPGGGTPTSFTEGPGGALTSPNPQRTGYVGVALDPLKRTTAQVYVDMNGVEAADPDLPIEVLLIGRRGERQLGTPIVQRIKNPVLTTRPVVGDNEREDRRFSLRFPLPADWIAGGDLDLEARVSFPPGALGQTFGRRECDADCSANDRYLLKDVDVFFERPPQLLIDAIRLVRTGQTGVPTPGALLSAAWRLFPGGERMTIGGYRSTLNVDTETGLTPTLVAGSNPAAWTCNGSTYTAPNFTTANQAQRACRQAAIDARIRAWILANPARTTSNSGFGVDMTESYDLLFVAHNYTGGANTEPGWQNDGNISGVSLTKPTSGAPYFTANWTTRPLTAAAHELGHALTAPHADTTCGGNSNGQVGESWPPDNAGRLQGTKFRPGIFDLGLPRSDGTLATGSLYDLMSYCANLADTSLTNAGDAWLSARNWNRFQETLDLFARRVGFDARPRTFRTSSAAVRTAAVRPGVAVGVVGQAGGSITRVLPADPGLTPPDDVPSSPVKLRSLAGNGSVLLERGVAVQRSSELPADAGGTFAGRVAPNAAAVELIRDGAVVDRIDRGAAPRVKILAPKRGTRVKARGSLLVRWNGSDADSGRLLATVQFSPDDGRRWRTVYDGVSTGSARIPGSFLQGSKRARVRVDLSDGFTQRRALSARFRADGTAPAVTIARPATGERATAGDRILLAGSAVDDRGAALTGRALRWFAGKRGLGSGENRHARLEPGRVTLRLVATDRNGRRGTARVRVRVLPRPLRITKLGFPRKVGKTQARVSVRIRTTGSARLRVRGKTYRVGTKTKRLRLGLPARPRHGLLHIPFTLKARGRYVRGTVQGAIELVRP